MKKVLSAAILGSALASGGCIFSADAGPVTTMTVSESGYTQIDLRGSADLFVTIGPEESISIKGSEERVNNVKTSVVDGVLVIEEESDGLFARTNGELTITVTAPSIDSVRLSGSGDIEVTGAKGESISLALSGSGEIHVSGEVDTASFTVSGSGEIHSTDLIAKNVSVSISGSGDADVYASESIDVKISGSGDVTYIGGAEDVKELIKGSGKVSAGD